MKVIDINQTYYYLNKEHEIIKLEENNALIARVGSTIFDSFYVLIDLLYTKESTLKFLQDWYNSFDNEIFDEFIIANMRDCKKEIEYLLNTYPELNEFKVELKEYNHEKSKENFSN